MRRRAVAGLAALAALAGSLAGCVGGGGTFRLTATFDDVGDLFVRHSVQMADVRIGEVTGIELTDDFRAKVTMAVDDDVQIPEAVTPVLGKTSLLGEKFIELRAKGEPGKGPFITGDADLGPGVEAPELEFVAEQAIGILGAVVSDDVAALVDTGARGFGGRGGELRGLVQDLGVISNTLADRAGDIGAIIDGLDRWASELAAGDDDIAALLDNLGETTQVLVENRNRALEALTQLSRLAAVQNDLLDRFRDDIDVQLDQISDVLVRVATASGEVGRLVDWLDGFLTNLPKAVPGEFTQVYMWAVPQSEDDRTNGGG